MQLRVAVFVVEQACAYPELDGRDLEPNTQLLWATEGDSSAVLATARVLDEPDSSARIGRVATTPAQRGHGWATRLMEAALVELVGRPVVVDSQTDKRSWYEQFGFVVDGEEFLEDGIAHVPMRRPAQPLGEPKATGTDRRQLLLSARNAAEQRVAQLRQEMEQIVAATADANTDDEHDPEGPTIAYERQQVAALLLVASGRLADLDQALAREAAGGYGRCERCGQPIPPQRLAARPTATTCVGCAGRH